MTGQIASTSIATMDRGKFPRTEALPTQSPIFWVGQKDRYLRQLLIGDIEAITQRELLVYFTDCDSSAMIDPSDAPYLAELLGKARSDKFDLLLETNGGQTDATENVVSLLQNCGSDFRVIVANRAKSNGTLVALAGSEIVMGANSELGPIDPILNNLPCTFIENIAQTGGQVDPMLLQLATHAIKQSKKLATSVLTKGMMNGRDAADIEAAVESLASRNTYHSHGSVIDHREATQLGLKVKFLPQTDELWQRIWLLRCMYAHDAKLASVDKIFESTVVGLSVRYPKAP